MNSSFLIDYSSYILFRALGAVLRRIPLSAVFFLGASLGDLLYLADRRHRQVAYANLKRATPHEMTPCQRGRLLRRFYRHFGQSIIEIFLIPRVNGEYVRTYITVQNSEYIDQAFSKGRGVIFTGMHEGSWELYNIITANLGFPFHFFVRDQRRSRFSRVVKLLNRYRSEKGCRLIVRRDAGVPAGPAPDGGRDWSGLRELIRVLKQNEAVGMSVDQGGKNGVGVSFFGKDASMASGAVRLAAKYGAVILPAFFYRVRGPHSTIVLEPPFEVTVGPDEEESLRSNLQRLVRIYEERIRQHPAEYLWTYKTWKYSRTRSVLILSDGKAGHLRQAEGVARSVEQVYASGGFSVEVATAEVRFRSPLRRRLFALGVLFGGRYACQGCLGCLRRCLTADSYADLVQRQPDVIISCGSALAGANLVLSSENGSRSVVCMKPSLLGLDRFDLVVMPAHDRLLTRRSNVVVTEGAAHPLDGATVEEQAAGLAGRLAEKYRQGRCYLGMLVGGSSGGYRLTSRAVHDLVDGVLSAAERLDAWLLVTTSRRTSPEAEEALVRRLKQHPRCALLVIANEQNIPEAVGGILGLSSCAVTTPDSISMISESVASGTYVVVGPGDGISAKHRRFISRYTRKRYAYAARSYRELGGLIEQVVRERPAKSMPMDRLVITSALERIL